MISDLSLGVNTDGRASRLRTVGLRCMGLGYWWCLAGRRQWRPFPAHIQLLGV